MNPVISREYVEKNYIKKSDLEEYLNKIISEIQKLYDKEENLTAKMTAGGFIRFTEGLKKEILEETEDDK